MSERWAEMVKLIVRSLGEFGQNCTFLHTTIAFITVKESAWEGQVQNMGFVIFAKMGIKDVDEQNMNPRKLLLLEQTGLKSKTSQKK